MGSMVFRRKGAVERNLISFRVTRVITGVAFLLPDLGLLAIFVVLVGYALYDTWLTSCF